MKKYLYNLLLTFSFQAVLGQVTLSTDFSDESMRGERLYDVWQVANDISPSYLGKDDEPQIRADLKMNCIRLSGGIKTGRERNLNYDMVKWNVDRQVYEYDFQRLLRVIDKAHEHGDEIYQLVLDNVPWCFQRGFTFVSLDKNSYDGLHFREFEAVEQYGNALPPDNMDAYGDYIEALITTLVDRYGKEQVKNWRFRIGSEIESPGHWKGSADDFVNYLDISMSAIKNVLPEAHVGIHTREPNYVAVSHKGLNYKGEKFVSFHNKILEHCYNNNIQLDSWGLSYYIQFDQEGRFNTDETWYDEFVSPLVNHPKWNTNTEINLEEFKATASFKGPDSSRVTLKSGTSHGEVAHIALANLFYQHSELNQIHRWLQYKNTIDGIANRELLSMVGKTRYKTKSGGSLINANNQLDAIFAKAEGTNIYEILIYNYNGTSTTYETPEKIDLSFVTRFPPGTKFKYRSSYYSNSHNKLQSFVAEPDFQESWYIEGITKGQKMGEANRVLKKDIYDSLYKSYQGHEEYKFSKWKNVTAKPSPDDSQTGSIITIKTELHSFAFRKFEIVPTNKSQHKNK
ncbi:MAG: hypothetical protein WBG71_13280 [Leeuwenhoekiella sp.]